MSTTIETRSGVVFGFACGPEGTIRIQMMNAPLVGHTQRMMPDGMLADVGANLDPDEAMKIAEEILRRAEVTPGDADPYGVYASVKWTPEKLMRYATRAVDDALGEIVRQCGALNPQVMKEARGSLGASPALRSLECALRVVLASLPEKP